MDQDKIDLLLDIRDSLDQQEIPDVDFFLDLYAVDDLSLTEEEKEAFRHHWKMLELVEERLAYVSSSDNETFPRPTKAIDDIQTHESNLYFHPHLVPNTEIIPGYTLISMIGQGGSGQVWLGIGPGNVRVAIKIIFPDNSFADLYQPTADNETIEIIRKVHYPHILQIHGIWNAKDCCIIISSLADETVGHCFQAAVEKGQPGIDSKTLLTWFWDIAKTLDFLNQGIPTIDENRYPILHCDIKPANIFLSGGSILIGDLGQARLLKEEGQPRHTGVTPLFASPECLNEHLSRNSDQYSLAVTWCYLRCGEYPYNGSLFELMHRKPEDTPQLLFFRGKNDLP